MTNNSTPRPWIAGLALGFALLLIAGPALAQQAGRSCAIDGATGLPIPANAPGICFAQTRSGAVIVQRTEDGLLFLAPTSGLGLEESHPDGTLGYSRYDHAAKLIYCPTGTIDPATGAPTASCMADGATVSPGPAALLGIGRVQANLRVDPLGDVACPSSIYVAGSASGRAGELYDLDGSVVLLPAAKGCERMQDSIEVAYVGRKGEGETFGRRVAQETEKARQEIEAEMRRVADEDIEKWERVEALMQLDEEEWARLERLIGLGDTQIDRLEEALLNNQTVWLTKDGQLSLAYKEDAVPIEKGIVDWLRDIVNRVKNVQSTLANRLTNRPTIRELIDQVDLGQVRDVLNVIKEQVGGLIAVINELREGFQDWKGNDCDPSSGCGQFKAKLHKVFDDLTIAWENIQRLGCIHEADLKIRPLRGFRQGEFFRTLLVDRPPPVALFAMEKVLRQRDGWENIVADLEAKIPDELTGFCSETAEAEATVPKAATASLAQCSPEPYPGARICCSLRPAGVRNALLSLRAILRVAKFGFDLSESWTTPAKAFCINVTAVAGGGGGTNMPNPVHSWSKTINLIIDKLDKSVDVLLNQRGKCMDRDAQTEQDLLDCKVMAEYFVPDTLGGRGKAMHARDVVNRRVAEMTEQGLGPSRQQMQKIENAQDFRELCVAYGEFMRDN